MYILTTYLFEYLRKYGLECTIGVYHISVPVVFYETESRYESKPYIGHRLCRDTITFLVLKEYKHRKD